MEAGSGRFERAKRKPRELREEQVSGLAAVRALGCVLIVLGHAAIPYMVEPPASIAWPVHDAGSRACDVLYLWCRGAQCAFFVLSGIMAAAALRHDVGGFVRSRLRLLGKPLVIAAVTVLPLCYLVWMLGWWRTGYITGGQLIEFRLATEDKRKLLGLGHLWYLEYLLIYCLAFAGGRWVRGPVLAARGLGGAMIAVAGAAMLAWGLARFDPGMITGFDNGFVPRWTYLLYNGGFFAIGAVLWRVRRMLSPSVWVWGGMLGAAQGLFAWWAWLELQAGDGDVGAVVVRMSAAVGFAVLNALGFTGWALVSKWRAGPAHGATRALVRSAYFTYLAHLPVVGLMHVALWGVAAPALLKFAVTGVVGLGVPMLAHRLVRARRGVVERAYSSPAS